MDLKKDKEKSNLNVEIDNDLIRKAKIKSTILNIDLKTYISRLIEKNTENISLDILKIGKKVR